MKILFSTTLLFSLSSLALAYDNFKMCCLVNQQRAQYGLPALGVEQRLTAAAQTQADYMGKTRIMSHNGPQNSQPGDRADWAGYQWQAIAENVAYGYPDEQSCMTNWMNSPGHRENILGDYRQFGSAVGYSSDGTPYYAQVFGSDGSNDNYPSCPSGYSGGGGRGGSKNSGYGGGGPSRSSPSYAPSRGSSYAPSHGSSYAPSHGSSHGPSYGPSRGKKSNNNDGHSYSYNYSYGPGNNNGGYTWYWSSGPSYGSNNNNGGSYGTTWTYY